MNEITYHNLIFTLYNRHTAEQLVFRDGNVRNLSRDNVSVLSNIDFLETSVTV
jgi:hypothetical protein